MAKDVHFTSGGGRIRPVENLNVSVGPESLAMPFPLIPTPLRGGGVGVATWTSVAAPFIVVVRSRTGSWEFLLCAPRKGTKSQPRVNERKPISQTLHVRCI